jgi:hypothetical protein
MVVAILMPSDTKNAKLRELTTQISNILSESAVAVDWQFAAPMEISDRDLEKDIRLRLQQWAREDRDSMKDNLRKKYAPRIASIASIASLEERIRKQIDQRSQTYQKPNR